MCEDFLSVLDKINRLYKNQSGMTLIDLAVALIVIGLLATPALQQYSDWKARKASEDTATHFNAIRQAIDVYYFQNGDYPCPASPGLGPNDANYGEEDCVGTSIGGGILQGTIPFSELKVPTDKTLDGWKNKITYTVTQNLTNGPATFDTTDAGGNLIVNGIRLDNTGQCDLATGMTPLAFRLIPGAPPTIDASVTDYILISHGATQAGAFNSSGAQSVACPAGATMDSENCDGDDTFIGDTCMKSDVEGSPNFYDDLVFMQPGAPTRIWSNSPIDPEDIFTNISNIGINNPNPQTNLDVIGNIKATNANTAQVCDVDGNNCFVPRLIGGYDPIMDCANTPNAMAMSGVSNASANCGTNFEIPTLGGCTPGKYVIGINADGKAICEP